MTDQYGGKVRSNMRIKNFLKENPLTYKVLKPFVDKVRIIIWSLIGILRMIPFLRSERIKELSEYRNLHKGERCFVVANGPSLTPADLEKIKNEYSFGCNGIYKIFEKTSWRPSFWCVSDQNIIDDTLQHVEKSVPFFTIKSCWRNSKLINGLNIQGGVYSIILMICI